jgi:predicted ATPase/Tfp pilus assembly protein PilF
MTGDGKVLVARADSTPAMTTFVGRRAEMEVLSGHLGRGERLVTVCGPPGIGKTRLVTEFIARHALDARFCDLTEASDQAGVVSAMARALVLDLVAAPTPGAAMRALGQALALRGELLIVVDNAERVAGEVAEALGGWLAETPHVAFLVTSRQVLGLAGEVIYELSPLSLPEDTLAIAASEAVALFVDRGRDVQVELQLDGPDGLWVAELVKRLDGLPLAIELAAARLRILGVRQLVENLDKRFALLSSRRRNTTGRHFALRVAIDESWLMLSVVERSALAQCAVFRGGFTLPAAAAVLELGGVADSPEIVDVIQSLRDKSLLTGSKAASGTLRLGMYESIREFALERLGPEERDRVMARHAAFYIAVGLSWAETIEQVGSLAVVAALRAEQENLLAVVRASQESPVHDAASTRRLASAVLALDALMSRSGPSHALSRMIDAAIEAAERFPCDPVIAGRVRCARARLRARALNYTSALCDLEVALELFRAASDLRGEANTLFRMAQARVFLGLLVQASALLAQALQLARRVNDSMTETAVLSELGILAKHDNPAIADQYFEEGLKVSREHGHRGLEGMLQLHRGIHLVEHGGEPARAQSILEEALLVSRHLGERRIEGCVIHVMGIVCQEQGDLSEARRKYQQALEILTECGDSYRFHTRGQLGSVAHEEGRIHDAMAHYQVTLVELERTESKPEIAVVLARLATALAAAGRVVEAEQALDRAASMSGLAPPLVASLDVHRGHLELAWAREAARAGREADATRHRDAARYRLEVARRAGAIDAGGLQAASAARSCEEGRFAIRILDAALRADPVAAEASGVSVLVVHAEGLWFRLPGAHAPVRFQRRRVLRLLLAKLAEARSASPGSPVSFEQLQRAGWEGEKIFPDAAANRMHVALSELRKLGFRDLLLARAGGYLLDPEVPIQLAAAAEPSASW